MDVEATIPATGRIHNHSRELPRDPAGDHWRVRHELAGRIRLHHPALQRRKNVCRAIERDLLSVVGIENCRASPLTGNALVHYNAQKLRREQVIEILDSALSRLEIPANQDRTSLHFPLCAASVPLAAAAQFAAPVWLPVSAGVLVYTALPSFQGAYQAVAKEKRLGSDVLDSILVAGCLASGAVFAGSVLCLCLAIGRAASRRTRDDSQMMLLSAFGKAPRFARVYQSGAAIETLLDKIKPGDVIVVQAGDVVPVDGVVRDGLATIDQRALTGDAAPVEKTVGDRVFASTLMISGKAFVEVESTGEDTVSARIGRILSASADCQLASQFQRERFADRAVLPTLGLAGAALATIGPSGAMAVLFSDFRTGMRLSAPLALLTSVMLCAHKGIVVKEGRALELMNDVDTVLFDATNMPSRVLLELGPIIAGLRERGIKHVAVISEVDEALPHELAESLGVDDYSAGVQPADKAAYVEQLQQRGHKVCYVGDGIKDSTALQQADVSISWRGASSITADAAQIVFLDEGLDRLCELRDVARRLEETLNRSWNMVVIPNLLCLAGAFTMGFGVMAALVTNNLAALAALVNALLPLRHVADERLEQELLEDLRSLYHPRDEPSIDTSVMEAECLGMTIDDDHLKPTGEPEYGTIQNESVEVVGIAD